MPTIIYARRERASEMSSNQIEHSIFIMHQTAASTFVSTPMAVYSNSNNLTTTERVLFLSKYNSKTNANRKKRANFFCLVFFDTVAYISSVLEWILSTFYLEVSKHSEVNIRACDDTPICCQYHTCFDGTIYSILDVRTFTFTRCVFMHSG